jgi:hypothetical protein
MLETSRAIWIHYHVPRLPSLDDQPMTVAWSLIVARMRSHAWVAHPYARTRTHTPHCPSVFVSRVLAHTHARTHARTSPPTETVRHTDTHTHSHTHGQTGRQTDIHGHTHTGTPTPCRCPRSPKFHAPEFNREGSIVFQDRDTTDTPFLGTLTSSSYLRTVLLNLDLHNDHVLTQSAREPGGYVHGMHMCRGLDLAVFVF